MTLTGSEAAGRAVGANAGSAIKPSVLELGGSDPLVVLSDGDPIEAAKVALSSRMLNTGQSCIAAKRLIVVEEHADTFIRALRQGIEGLAMGDPTEEDTDIGPLAKSEFVAALHHQVMESMNEVLDASSAAAFFLGLVPSTHRHLVDVTETMTCFREETFGPVAVVIRADSDDDALRLANTSRLAWAPASGHRPNGHRPGGTHRKRSRGDQRDGQKRPSTSIRGYQMLWLWP